MQSYLRIIKDILSATLKVSNIETFAEDALEKMIALTQRVLDENPLEEIVQYPTTREQEDAVFSSLGLPDIQEILDSISEVCEEVRSLQEYLSRYTGDQVATVITPPQEGEISLQTGNGNGFAYKRMFPRLLTLLYILSHDFDLFGDDDLSIVRGSVREDMMRQTPYLRISIPSLHRVVYICDEEGNASYIFDTEKLQKIACSFDTLDALDKGEKNHLIEQYPEIGIRLKQTDTWRRRMAFALGNGFGLKSGLESETCKDDDSFSEFSKGRKFLPFEEFQDEVRGCFPGGMNGVWKWYREVSKDHPNWPSAPDETYKDLGWKSWPELVGKAKPLSFEDFQKEVRGCFLGEAGNVVKWYRKAHRDHHGWPARPDIIYKDVGWKSWPELVRRMHVDFLSFEEFQEDARACFPDEVTNVWKWYREVSKDHPNWPSAPDETYKYLGWKNLPELVGKAKPLSFESFQKEVRACFSGEVKGVARWYSGIYKDHPNWPSNPSIAYKDVGWKDWYELVGRAKSRVKLVKDA